MIRHEIKIQANEKYAPETWKSQRKHYEIERDEQGYYWGSVWMTPAKGGDRYRLLFNDKGLKSPVSLVKKIEAHIVKNG